MKKNKEIDRLQHVELEIAEIKAQQLLSNDNPDDIYDVGILSNRQSSLRQSSSNLGIKTESVNYPQKIESLESFGNKKNGINTLKIDFLNTGTQTLEQIYSEEQLNIVTKERDELKSKLEKIKQEFIDYKDKSQKIILTTEENYNKVLKENQAIKQEYKDLREKPNNITNSINTVKNGMAEELDINHKKYYKGIKSNLNFNPNSFITCSDSMDHNSLVLNSGQSKYLETSTKDNYLSNRTNINNKLEYLKNVLLKYLEANAVGDQFQIKILENVMFSVLNVSSQEKGFLNEKRVRSSFYYNIWYNAKSFISSKIYGTSYDDSYTPSSSRRNKLGQYEENIG